MARSTDEIAQRQNLTTITTTETYIGDPFDLRNFVESGFFFVNSGSVDVTVTVYASASGITTSDTDPATQSSYTAAQQLLEWDEVDTFTLSANSNEIWSGTRIYNYLRFSAVTSSGTTTVGMATMGVPRT